MKQLQISINVETSEQVGKVETYQSESATQLFTVLIGKIDELNLPTSEIYGNIFECFNDIKKGDVFYNYYEENTNRIDAILSLKDAYQSVIVANLKGISELRNAIDCNLLILAQDEKVANCILNYINDAYGFKYDEDVEELLFN